MGLATSTFLSTVLAVPLGSECLPPFILYKGEKLYRRWTEGGPAGALHGANESGCMDVESYLSWFNKLFLPALSHLTKTGPVVLIQDMATTLDHISMELIRKTSKNNIILLRLPSSTTHLLQPFPVFFSSQKGSEGHPQSIQA